MILGGVFDETTITSAFFTPSLNPSPSSAVACYGGRAARGGKIKHLPPDGRGSGRDEKNEGEH
jgi:hypothetical protein